MDRSSRLPCAGTAATSPASAAAEVPLTRGPPASNGQALAGNETAGPAPAILGATEDHDRIARGLNDIVVHRLFGAGIDLHAALGMVGAGRAADKIYHAIGELDQAITDIRNTIFNHGTPPRSPAQPTTTDSRRC
jgi:Histidine kinase